MVQGLNITPDNDIYSNAEGIHSTKPLYFFLERYMGSFVAEMVAFVKSIQEDTPPPVTGLDGRAPVVIGLAAWKSYRDKRPVRLSEIS
jgi:myo-inositol 2-dehydrogenase/D-chiro-inositol 1-dehydrogenase